jgi:hypothetical protein
MAMVKLLDGRCFDDREVRWEDGEPWFLDDGICYGGRCAIVVIEGEDGEEEHNVRTEHADPWCVWVEYVQELDPNLDRLEFKRQRALEDLNFLQRRYIKSMVDKKPAKEISMEAGFIAESLTRYRREFRRAAKVNSSGIWE